MGFWVYGSLTWVSMLSYGEIALCFNVGDVNHMGNANLMGAKPYSDLTWDLWSMRV